MGEYISDSVFIGSIYPGKRHRIAKYFGPSMRRTNGTTTFYELKPVKKGGKPFVLEVSDVFQHERDVLNAGRWKMDPVFCDQIADNLVTEWAGNIPGLPPGAFPGIMRIVGTVPTQAELQAMKDGLTIYFEHYFLEGAALAKENPKLISPEHRLAAEWLGRPTEWSHPAQILETVPCPACRKSIPPDSYVCQFCQTTLRALPKDLALLNNAPVSETTEENQNVLSTV